MENNPVKPVETKSKFSLGHVLAIASLIGLIGFGLGANLDQFNLQSFNSQNEELPESLDYSSVDELYQILRENYAGSLTEDELMVGLKKGLVEATGDPFSEFLTAEEAAELERGLEGEFGGIGAEIGMRDDRLVIIAPLDGTPASEAGLRPGDAILAINDEDAGNLSVQEAVNKIRGEEGSDVVLTLRREGGAAEELTITRATIEIPSVRTEMIEGNIAYIELVRFGSESANDFRRAALEMREQGAESIILDVRNNPGGFLDVAVSITSEFLEPGDVIVEERRGDEVIGTERARNGGTLVGLPTVVLVNGGSASASEIIAGALRDQDAATIVGEQTFGKGSVQQLINIPGSRGSEDASNPLNIMNGGASNSDVLRVTIAKWYTPAGDNINELGVTPDIEVELTVDDFENDRDPQLDRAVEVLNER